MSTGAAAGAPSAERRESAACFKIGRIMRLKKATNKQGGGAGCRSLARFLAHQGECFPATLLPADEAATGLFVSLTHGHGPVLLR